MKRLGEMDMPKKRIGFAVAQREEAPQDDEGGIQRCRSYRCPCYGTINLGGKDWFCRFHAGRPGWAAAVVTESLNQHGALVSEVHNGFRRIAQDRSFSDSSTQTFAIGIAERLIASGYEVDLDALESEPNKCWNITFKQFIFGLDKMLSKHVNQAVKDHKE